MAYEQGDIVEAWLPFTHGHGGEYKTVLVASTRLSNQGRDITVAQMTGQIAKSRRRKRDYVLTQWEEAGLDRQMAIRPKLFVILKGRVGRRVGRVQADDRAGMLGCLRDLLGL